MDLMLNNNRVFNDYFYLSQKIVDHQWKIENLKDL